MNTPDIKTFIHDNSALFWYIPENKKEDIDHELLVETILNYGDMEAVLKLFNLLGINKDINYSEPVEFLCPEVSENEIKEFLIEKGIDIFPRKL
jgi:hypothetical protein